MVKLSVLIATHNGAETIDRTLQAMSALRPPEGGWKLIVVNNASTDATEQLVLKWRDRLQLHYLVEPRLGMAFAINTGLQHVEGDLAILTDDDVLPQPDFLIEWLRVADAHPQCGMFGGGITPHFDAPLPKWSIPRTDYSILYGETLPYPEGQIIFTPGMHHLNAFGANLAVRRSTWESGLRFGEDFCVGSNGLMGEDTDYVNRVYDLGLGVGHAPTARLGHIIHPHQLGWWWIHSRFFRSGRSMYMINDVKRSEDGTPIAIPRNRWRVKRVVKQGIKWAIALARFDGDQAFLLSRAIAYDLGALKQGWLMRRMPAPRS